jgi:hypothetical protein
MTTSRKKIVRTKNISQNIESKTYTLPVKFSFNKIFSDFMSRWIYTGTEWSWIYSRPLATSRAICNLVDHVIGSFAANSIHINETSMEIVNLHHVFVYDLNYVNAGLSFHFPCIHRQGIDILQHNILSSVPIWT